jgi:hypothetical protein
MPDLFQVQLAAISKPSLQRLSFRSRFHILQLPNLRADHTMHTIKSERQDSTTISKILDCTSSYSKIIPGGMANRSPEALASIESEHLPDERMILLRQMS